MIVGLRLLLTEDCNLACHFCHNEGQFGVTRYLPWSPQQLARVLEVMSRQSAELRIKISGGEPTLHPLFQEYIEVALHYSSPITVITNGASSDALLAAAALGNIQFSVNMPSVDAVKYSAITQGNFEQVEATILALRANMLPVALNTYWQGNLPLEDFVALVNFSTLHGTTLKILHPCQKTDPSGQRTLLTPLKDSLEGLGYQLQSVRGHIHFFCSANGNVVRLQRPWCPDECALAREDERTLRIDAQGRLHSCLDGRVGLSVPIDPGGKNVADLISAGIHEVALSCSGPSMKVRIQPRRGFHARN